jgi:hypothetical protein
MRPIGIARRRGFETAIRLGRLKGHVAVSPLDEVGNSLATSRTIRL